MRRTRHKLQVSTFPFLAVLLGAMGALILLLLVMDRRAKIVARNKALEAHAAKQALALDHQKQAADDEHKKSEWESKRRELHELLLSQEREWSKHLGALQSELSKLLGQEKTEQEAAIALQKRLAAEEVQWHAKKKQLDELTSRLAQADRQSSKAQEDLARLAQELDLLEKTLRNRKAQKHDEKEVYSLVPYRGKHGDDRKPIYVECTLEGVIFHPNRQVHSALGFDVAAFRKEVQNRGAKLVREKRAFDVSDLAPTPPDPHNPYVLFLVRPEGIESYYQATSALRGFELDFGYEFIDAAWMLDFSTDVVGQASPTPKQRTGPSTSPTREQGSVPAPPRGKGVGDERAGPITAKPGTTGLPSVPTTSTVMPFDLPWRASGGNGPKSPALADVKSHTTKSEPRPSGSGVKPQPSVVPNPSPTQKGTGAPPPRLLPADLAQSAQPTLQQRNPTATSPTAKGDEKSPTGEESSPLESRIGPRQPPVPPALGKLLGNRDYLITIECFESTSQLIPGGQVFNAAGGAHQAAHNQALVRAVVGLVNQRQATVRPGEASYRPVLRFRVHPEGRRTYFRVYPLFENMGYPMFRENLEN
ncbi:MAG: hypothetical protein L0Y72_04330 [Gemmataceae bacterium]|nr:hypothetical protein [Gemmataceae bacterium]MCI0738247.1 hypothetical protein [Gemmataceae bacterium]